MSEPIKPTDVVIDLTNGRAMQVMEKAADRVADWTAENNYDLKENYGNSRFETTDDDTVWTCVYANSLQSDPSKDYAFPESRIRRVETEHAMPDGERATDILTMELLADMIDAADDIERDGLTNATGAVRVAARKAGIDADLIGAASELADVRSQALAADGGDQ